MNSVEILHVDTSRSRELHAKLSPIEKSGAEKFLRGHFKTVCSKHGGRLRDWDGDGGFALFPSNGKKVIGASIRAGEEFVQTLPSLNAQTARGLRLPCFERHVRIKAHRGEVFLAKISDVDSARPEDFDDFLKHEKRFAPQDDELFITDELFRVLLQTDKARFERFRKSVVAGSLRTDLYRLKRTPIPRAEDIFKRGDELSTITSEDWKYLRNQIEAHYLMVAARNQITSGLIEALTGRSIRRDVLISSKRMLSLTLYALYSYLQEAFPGHRFRVCFWRPFSRGGKVWLKIAAFQYPEGESTDVGRRVIHAENARFKVCEAFRKKEPIVTSSVFAARLTGDWHDFDERQATQNRALASAVQIPVYCRVAPETADKRMLGVLSLDSDKPDTFLPEELALWRDELVGFLANLALAEKLRDCGA